MNVLDTNMISALMQSPPDPVVKDWFDAQDREGMWTASVCVFEIRVGINILASGRRRNQLLSAFRQVLVEDLEERVLPFDTRAAEKAAEVSAELRRLGRTVEFRDVQIAGTALAFDATLVTANTRHFVDTGVRLINPYDTR